MAGNSLGPKKDVLTDSFEERKKFMTRYDNVKQVKKKEPNPVLKWIRDMFFSGRTAKDIALEVAEKQVIPQIKDNLRNSLVSMIDLKLYKDHKSTSVIGSGTPSSSFITNYVKFGDGPSSSTKTALEENKQKNRKIIESGFETPAFPTESEARNFIASMHAFVDKYRMTVLDLAWMQGKNIDFTWEKYGWDKEEILGVKNPTHINASGNSWIVELPKAHELYD